jgi:hypothetical protein
MSDQGHAGKSQGDPGRGGKPTVALEQTHPSSFYVTEFVVPEAPGRPPVTFVIPARNRRSGSRFECSFKSRRSLTRLAWCFPPGLSTQDPRVVMLLCQGEVGIPEQRSQVERARLAKMRSRLNARDGRRTRITPWYQWLLRRAKTGVPVSSLDVQSICAINPVRQRTARSARQALLFRA